MKAKRLTALALAALMTASGTSVAFAKEYANSDYDLDFVSSSGDYYYGYDEDENAIIKKKPSEFQPGDTIYIPLLEDSDEKFNNSRGKNFTVYIDGNKFDVGDSYVDDVGVVRKRGYITIPGTTTTTYTLNLAGTALGAFHNKTIDGATSKEDALTKGIALINQNKDDLIAQETNSYKRTVYVFNNKAYANKEDAIEAATSEGVNGLEKVDSYYVIDGAEKKTIPSEWKTSEIGYVYTVNDIKGYALDLPSALVAIEYKEYTQANFPDVEYYYQATEEPAKYGDVTKDVTEGKKIEYSKEGAQIWINSKTNKYITGNIEEENIGVATSNTIAKISANEYYDTSNVVHTVVTVNEPAYFNPDGTFYSKVADVPATNADVVTEQQGYVVGTDAYLDDAAAKKEATKKIDNLIQGMNVKDNIIENSSTSEPTTVRDWGYWAYIDTKKSTTTKDIDIVGKIYVGTSKSDAEDETGFYVDITLTNANTDNGDYFDEVDGDITIEDGERAVVSFADDAGELIVEFGDDAWFEFNARGQGKLNLAYNTKFNRDFAYDYDHANIDFINFVAEPTTNKTGTLYIYADEDSYIYEVTSKGAKKINGAYYDDDEGAWVIRTRHLTSYAISDRRLKTIDQMEDDKNSSSSSKPSGSQGSGSGNGNYKPIPDTGR